MDANARRRMILERIKKSDIPVTGGELAAALNVTRQAVVADVALLRAGGIKIVATPSGYVMADAVLKTRPVRVFTCRHLTLEQTEEELMIMVENGGRVRDVIIEHPVYGEISGSLMISTPEAVRSLVECLKRKDSLPLSSITDGIHMHTVEASSEEAIADIERGLKEAGILI